MFIYLDVSKHNATLPGCSPCRVAQRFGSCVTLAPLSFGVFIKEFVYKWPPHHTQSWIRRMVECWVFVQKSMVVITFFFSMWRIHGSNSLSRNSNLVKMTGKNFRSFMETEKGHQRTSNIFRPTKNLYVYFDQWRFQKSSPSDILPCLLSITLGGLRTQSKVQMHAANNRPELQSNNV